MPLPADREERDKTFLCLRGVQLFCGTAVGKLLHGGPFTGIQGTDALRFPGGYAVVSGKSGAAGSTLTGC